MDHIDGEMLYECWHKQSTLMQFRITCTLRLYLKQMRSIERASVGTLGSGRVFGILFQDYEFGPFDTPRRFKHFCQYVSSVGWDMQTRFCRARGQQTPPVPRLPADWTPVRIAWWAGIALLGGVCSGALGALLRLLDATRPLPRNRAADEPSPTAAAPAPPS